jgi:hypothetical protein
MSDIKHSMPNLFRSLRAEPPAPPELRNSDAPTAGTAEPQWPILNSIKPKKSPMATPLSEDEKILRRTVSLSGPAALAQNTAPPSLSSQLAYGLNRMLGQKQPHQDSGSPRAQASTQEAVATKPPEAQVEKSMPPVKESGLFRNKAEPAPISDPPASKPLGATRDESLKAIFRRLEQTHQPAPTPSTKPPAFLSRLGKR